MEKETMKTIFSILILMFLITGCEENDTNNVISGPRIEWILGGTTTTYTYSGGVISGYYFYRSFNVLEESGEVTINVQVNDDDNTRVTASFNVEKDVTYSLKVKGSKTGSQASSPGSNCLKVVFSSPNSQATQEIKVGTYLISGGGIDTYYCPASLIFGEINLVE